MINVRAHVEGELNTALAPLGVYLVSVSGGHQADVRGMDRPNRISAKSRVYTEIGTILAFPMT